MRQFILSLSEKCQALFIVVATIAGAFFVAVAIRSIFDIPQLQTNTDLITSVYSALGTTYAVLLAFAVSGVWQNFSKAIESVQAEADALSDLVHMVEATVKNASAKTVRKIAIDYAKQVLEYEWPSMASHSKSKVAAKDINHDSAIELIHAVKSIHPTNARDAAVFAQALTLLNTWLDARRIRLFCARGDRAKALWPLLIAGALVQFTFHGLFVAGTLELWIILLLGLSLVVGMCFYLIFSLDCPFSGSLSADSLPFQWVIHWFQSDQVMVEDVPKKSARKPTRKQSSSH